VWTSAAGRDRLTPPSPCLRKLLTITGKRLNILPMQPATTAKAPSTTTPNGGRSGARRFLSIRAGRGRSDRGVENPGDDGFRHRVWFEVAQSACGIYRLEHANFDHGALRRKLNRSAHKKESRHRGPCRIRECFWQHSKFPQSYSVITVVSGRATNDHAA
jgi:hypothetical protein